MKLSIIIPVYNEKENILKLLALVEAVHFIDGVEKEIILVDDCSTDGTSDILKNVKSHTVLFHEKNQGKGAAIRTGLEKATGEFTVIQDADLEYDPNDLNLLLAEAINKQADAIFGSRRLNRANKQYSGVTFYWGGLLVTKIGNWIYGIDLTDEPTCYKMVKTDLLRQMNLVCNRFEFCPEVVAKLARMNIEILEVPIHYYPRSAAEGKKIKWFDGVEAIETLWKYRKWGKEKTYFNAFDRFIRTLRIRKILPYLPKRSTILDFGCGRDGTLLSDLHQRNIIIRGIGIDPFAEEKAQNNIELRKGGVERIGENEQFDAITMLAVLEHLTNPEEVLEKLHKALKLDGKIILTVPSIWSQPVLEFLAFTLHVISEAEIRDHKRYYDRTSLLEILKKTGFSETKHHYFQFGMNNLVIAKR